MAEVKRTIGKGLSAMHRTTSRFLQFEKYQPTSLEEFQKQVSLYGRSPEDNTYRITLISSFASLRTAYMAVTNEENAIARMERRAHIRNIIFRGLTTLVIGFSIMFVYWIATCLGIQMPLKGI